METHRSLRQLQDIVLTLKADLGVRLDVDAERMILVDDRGDLIEGPKLLTLIAMLVFKQVPGALVAASINSPSVLETLADEYGGKVIWTSTDPRSLMHTATLGASRIVFAGCPTGEMIFPSFSPGSDAMFAFAKLLAMITVEKAPLSEMVKWIPPFAMAYQTVPCGFADKGRVMRLLIEHSRDLPTEMIDGVKIFYDKGWVLVVPDRLRPQICIWTQAENQIVAEELAAQEQKRILSFIDMEIPTYQDQEYLQGIRWDEQLPEERAFHFWTPDRYLGVRARSLKEFINTLHYIDPSSLSYHIQRGDFANWMEYELEELQLADKVRRLKGTLDTGEDLRKALLDLFSNVQ